MKETANAPSAPNPQSRPSLKFIDMPVVLLGEDSTEYAQLRQQIEDYVRPLDIFEKMYVSDLAYYSWDSLRYRKAVTKLIDSSREAALARVIGRLLPWEKPKQREFIEVLLENPLDFEPSRPQPSQAQLLAEGYLSNDKAAVEKVDRLMKERGVSWDAVRAEAISMNLDEIDRLKRMILTADSFRSALLGELDRHRASPVRRFSASMQQIENVPPQNNGQAT
jgi:hypothetical protein